MRTTPPDTSPPHRCNPAPEISLRCGHLLPLSAFWLLHRSAPGLSSALFNSPSVICRSVTCSWIGSLSCLPKSTQGLQFATPSWQFHSPVPKYPPADPLLLCSNIVSLKFWSVSATWSSHVYISSPFSSIFCRSMIPLLLSIWNLLLHAIISKLQSAISSFQQ